MTRLFALQSRPGVSSSPLAVGCLFATIFAGLAAPNGTIAITDFNASQLVKSKVASAFAVHVPTLDAPHCEVGES